MARQLNRSRIAISRVIAVLLLVAVFFTSSLFPVEGSFHEFLDVAGTILVGLCALGRLYTTAFLGGYKNDTLITHGPFSIVRNPLYMFSLIGFTGVALMTTHLVAIVGIPLGFWILYSGLIRREEGFLESHFGDEYRAYKKTVPRLIPSFKNYHVPEYLQMKPEFLAKGFKDAIWWLAAFPLVELAEVVQDAGFIKPFILLP